MGLALTLLILNGPRDLGEKEPLFHAELRLNDYLIFSQMRDMKEYVSEEVRPPIIQVNQLPPQMSLDNREQKKGSRRKDDANGDNLTFVFAKEMKKITVERNRPWNTKAVMAYIKHLPDETPIILDWH